MKNRTSKNSGQTLVEFVISLIVIPIFFVGIVHLTQVLMVRIRLVQAARHGVWLISTGRVSDAVARQEITDFLATGFPRLQRRNITIRPFIRRQVPFSLDTVEIEYNLRTFQFTDNFFRPLTFADYRIRESATVGNVSQIGRPYLAF